MLFLAAAFGLGCNRNNDEVQGPTGTLKGKVLLAGAPAPAGVAVALQHAPTGRLYMSLTDASGAYFIDKPTTKLPTGRYDVSIAPPMEVEDRSEKAVEDALDGPKDRKPAPPPVNIPTKYRNSHESGLGFDLEAGDNERDFNLKT
jgi:hypothetical protein